MRILLVSNSTRGGANRALLRHHRALRARGIESSVLVGEGTGDPAKAIFSLPEMLGLRGDKPEVPVDERMRRMKDLPIVMDADVVELRAMHNGHGREVLDVQMLAEFAHSRPIIWRLSDMWAFTGGCAYAFDCVKWRDCCDACPIYEGAEGHKKEVRRPGVSVREAFARKRAIYAAVGPGLHIVCPSLWMLSHIAPSILSGCASATCIPVGVDVGIYRPADRTVLRAGLALPENRVVLAACIPNLRNFRKAADLLWEALRILSDGPFHLLFIGGDAGAIPLDIRERFPCTVTPFIDDETAQARYFAAADIHCFPSRCDNSAQTLVEAAACGVPTVCFAAGGNGEYVVNGRTGWTLSPYDTAAMARSIEQMAADAATRRAMGRAAAVTAGNLWSLGSQTEAFLALYAKVLRSPVRAGRETRQTSEAVGKTES